MSIWTAALLSVALLSSPAGQGAVGAVGSVSGVVRSSDDGHAIAYAHVRILGDTVSDWTDADGSYRLDGIEPGRWRLRVAHPGHDSVDVVVLIPAGRQLRLDITLDALPGPAPAPLSDFQPFQVEYTLPALLNTADVKALIKERYPQELAARGVAGESVLRLWLDEEGRVVRGVLSASCGHPALDTLALEVAEAMRFRPARNRDQAVRVIVRIPVVFTAPAREKDAPRQDAPRR